MDKYKTIKYSYSIRSKRYKIQLKGYPVLHKAIKHIIGNKRLNQLIFKYNMDGFEIYEFFLLELEYILSNIVKGENALKIIDILTHVNDLLDFIRNETWIKHRYIKDKDILDMSMIKQQLKFEPLPHQLKAFDKYEDIKTMANLRGFLLDAGAGTGKTFMSLALGEALHYETIIIIAPRQVINNVWKASLIGDKRLYRVDQSVCMLGTENKTYNGERFVIMHYEYLDKLVNDKKLQRQLKRKKAYLIVDEFHNFNEIKSKRTNNLLNFINYMDFKDISLLTGTPIKFDTVELVPMLYVLDTKFPPVVEQFKIFYKSIDNITDDLLQYRFGLYRERIEKDMNNLPNITIKEHRVKVPNYKDYLIETVMARVAEYKEKRLSEIMDNYEMYENQFYSIISLDKSNLYTSNEFTKEQINDLFNQYLSKIKVIREAADKNQLQFMIDTLKWIKSFEERYVYAYLDNENKKLFKSIVPIIKYPQFKVMGEALGKIILGTRIQCYRDLARYTNYKPLLSITDKKGIVFSNYISTSEIAIEKLKKEKYIPIGVYGPYTKELNSRVKIFKTDPSINPLVATYKSLSTGVPLTEANVVICLDIPFRMYIFDQAVARAHRIGQDKNVIVFIIKLDTKNEFNITDRDLFILNLSKLKVELITKNKFVYDMPKNEVKDEDSDNDIVESEITDIALNMLDNDLSLPTKFLKTLKEKIKVVWK